MASRLGGLLRTLNGKRGVVGERNEHVELLVRGAPQADRFVHRQDAEQVSVGVTHRHEERVLGLPRIVPPARLRVGDVARGVALGGPVVLARLHDVRAAALEALVEQRLPVAEPSHPAEQVGLRSLVAVHGRNPEVVARTAVEVDDDRPVAERLGDRSCNCRQELG